MSTSLSILPATAGATLGDASVRLGFDRCRELLDSVPAQLHTAAVRPGQRLELVCEHSVAGALLLLALLENGHSFVVLRPDDADAVTPGLCRHRVSARLDTHLRLRLEVRTVPDPVGADPNPRVYFRTSGTTGAPKLAVHSAARLVGNARNCIERLRLRPSNRVTIPVPIHHMYGLGAALLPSVLAGASIDLVQDANLLRFLERERRFSPDVAFLTPSFADGLARGRRAARAYTLSVVAGDSLRPETFERHERVSGCIVQLYGSTELGAVAAGSPDDPPALRAGSVGEPLPGVECRLASAPRGPLLCRHPFGLLGYADLSGRLEPVPEWFPTRDLAELDSGRIRVLGRLDHAVNRDGVLIALAEVEARLQDITGIAQVAAVTAGSDARGEAIVAYCVLENGAALTPEAIRSASFDRLPRRAVPDRVEVVPELPLLPTGKLDRQSLARAARREPSP